jgi:hypothetical protein
LYILLLTCQKIKRELSPNVAEIRYQKKKRNISVSNCPVFARLQQFGKAKKVYVSHIQGFFIGKDCHLDLWGKQDDEMYRPKTTAFVLALIGISASTTGVVGQTPVPTINAATRWGSCTNVIAIPGNAHNLDNAACAVCNGGAYQYYPCDTAGLCMCQGETVPPEYTGIFSSCSNVVAISGNQNGVTDADCAKCNGGAYRYYPCDSTSWCKCGSGSTPSPPVTTSTTTKAPATTTKAPATTTKVPATTTKAPATTTKAPATTTKAPATTTKAPATTTKAPATTTKAPATTTTTTKATTTTTTKATTAAPTTTTTTTKAPTTTAAPKNAFASCTQGVIAIPGNPDGVTDTQCAACSSGTLTSYPCDNAALCYCKGGTIPPAYTLPFTGCSDVYAVPGNPNSVTDAQCAQCNNGAYRYYPCDQPNVLCVCGHGTKPTTTKAPTTTTTTTKAPTTAAPTTAAPTPAPTTSAPLPAWTVPTLGNTLATFRTIQKLTCDSMLTAAQKACGGRLIAAKAEQAADAHAKQSQLTAAKAEQKQLAGLDVAQVLRPALWPDLRASLDVA